MSFGMRTWGADGTLQLDENSFTIRVVLSQLVTISGVATYQEFSVPGITASNGAAILLPIAAYDTSRNTQYETEVVNDVVRVYNYVRGYSGSQNANPGAAMRLVVVRFS